MNTYLVTGATGNLGSRIVRQLRRSTPSSTVIALARPGAETSALETRGVRVARGDYDDRDSIRNALHGVTRLVLVSSPALDPAIRVSQHRNVIEESARVGVDHVVYTSALGAEHDPGHLTTEQELAASLPHTILRNGIYSEPFARRAIEEAARSGYITSSTDGAAVRTASTDDLAAAAVVAVTAADPSSSTRLLNGPPWTYDDLARHLAARLGRTVTHRRVSDQDLGPLGQLHALFRARLLAQPADELTALLRRAPRGIHEVADDTMRGADSDS
ncbi:NAD(P)H-binding protein [Nocardioides nitrophenolicus]|uniref:NAD(P)H-binding protein n=1 Tax=Nocardioides nitrophenolicus TaxID=60489 RepID=UPI001959EC89|nr:NAD(P)H-binding protein [Nocardioides nitrophenolicus]MBM7517404.1 NAD(P)H dehydrogenase (quinone) [Nocardioides nitrophenolicus]